MLIDSKEIHFEALNKSLASISDDYVISKKDHLLKFDGLPTMEKLAMLSKERSLPLKLHQEVLTKSKHILMKNFLKLIKIMN